VTVQEEFSIYKKETTFQIEILTEDLAKAAKENKSMKKELKQIRSERDEQARNDASWTTRLVGAKKKEGERAYATEVFEKRTDQLQIELSIYKKETTFQIKILTEDLAKAAKENTSMKKELEQIRKSATYIRYHSKQCVQNLPLSEVQPCSDDNAETHQCSLGSLRWGLSSDTGLYLAGIFS
jgi:hypothetical protein